jgi:hypothetical protein
MRARSLDVMKLARAGYLAGTRFCGWAWSYGDGSTATVGIKGGRDLITLEYRFKSGRDDWDDVSQPIPITWGRCRFGGERPWFVCDVSANGEYCGRRAAKLYGAGRLFACRRCYRLGYRIQRGDRMDRAHLRLARLHRKLGAEYERPDLPPPPKPKWMRWKTYSRISAQIEAGEERLDDVFMAGAHRLLARLDKADPRRGIRR